MSRMIAVLVLLVIAAVLAPLHCFAQAPDTLWTKTYGGYSQDKAYQIQQTTDGGYIIAGATQSFGAGNWDFYLVKTDANGNAQWTHTYGGSNLDFAYAVQQTTDGGYAIAGYTLSYGAGYADFYLVKTDAGGNVQWTRTYGGPGQDYCYSMQQTTDGGYILGGCTFSYTVGLDDYYLVKTDANGNQVWAHSYGTVGTEECYGLQQTSDGGYIAAGFSAPFGNNSQRAWLVKTNANGDTLWTHWYDGAGYDYAQAVQQTSDGGYIAAGRTDSWGAGGYDFYLIKTTANGDTLWTRTYGGGGIDQGYAVWQATDGGYIVAGYSTSFSMYGDWDFYVVRTNAGGDTLWTKTYGGSGTDEGRSVIQTSDGGFAIAGNTGSFGAGSRDFYVVRLESETTAPSLSVTLTPVNPPITVPAAGGSFQFSASVQRVQAPQAPFYVWSRDRFPDGSYTANLLGPVQINPPVGQQVTRLRVQNVPGSWPAGVHWYLGYANPTVAYPAVDADSFSWTKLSTSNGEPWINDAVCSGEPFPGEEIPSLSRGDRGDFMAVSPNPFNPTTALSYQLQAASQVRLTVWDTAGRLVATLVHGWQEAGSQKVNFDGASLPSGVYLYTLTAGTETLSGKMLLLK